MTLQLALLEHCVSNVLKDEEYTKRACHGWAAGEGGFAPVLPKDWEEDLADELGANLCAGRLFLCLGQQNQLLAEALVPTKLEAKPFVPETTSLLDEAQAFRVSVSRQTTISHPAESPDGYETIRWRRDGRVHRYLIPPQTAENRTLLWRAATHAYREAAIRHVLAAVREHSFEYGVNSFLPEYVAGVVDSLERLAEAAELTSAHERSVAVAQPGGVAWQGDANSYASALALWASSNNTWPAEWVLRPVTVNKDDRSVREVLRLLRAASVSIDPFNADGSERTDAAVMDEVALVLNPDGPDAPLITSAGELLQDAGAI